MSMNDRLAVDLRSRAFLPIILALIGFVCLLLLEIALQPANDSLLLFAAYGITFSAFFILLLIYRTVSRQPLLLISSNGIELYVLLKHRLLWPEVKAYELKNGRLGDLLLFRCTGSRRLIVPQMLCDSDLDTLLMRLDFYASESRSEANLQRLLESRTFYPNRKRLIFLASFLTFSFAIMLFLELALGPDWFFLSLFLVITLFAWERVLSRKPLLIMQQVGIEVFGSFGIRRFAKWNEIKGLSYRSFRYVRSLNIERTDGKNLAIPDLSSPLPLEELEAIIELHIQASKSSP